MKSSREAHLPIWLTRILAVSLLFVLAMMPIHAFISTWGGTAIGPLWLWKSWKEIVLAILAVTTLAWVLSSGAARRAILRDRLAQIIASYTTLVLLLAAVNLSHNGSAATSAGLAMDLRYILAAFIAYVLFRVGQLDWKLISSRALMALVVMGAALAVFAVLQVTVLPRDLLSHFGYEKHVTIAPFMTIDENPHALRAFATLRGPNELGAFLILPLIAAFLYIKRTSWRIALWVLIAAGIVTSVSRSAWIGAVAAMLAVLALTYGGTIFRSKRFVYAAIAGAIAVALLIVSAVSVPALRLAIFRSSPTDPSLTEGSTDQHFIATKSGVERVAHNPLGCGPGCAGPASYYGSSAKISENYYVQIAEELGVAGLILWLTIAYLVVKRLYEHKEDILARTLLASFVGISLIGLLLHVWIDDPLSITWWGLAGATLGYYASAKAKKPVR